MQNGGKGVQNRRISVQNRVISVHFWPIIVQKDLEKAGDKVVTKKAVEDFSTAWNFSYILLYDRLRLKKEAKTMAPISRASDIPIMNNVSLE